MKGTDTFHLGDGYYVYVNYDITSDGYIADKDGTTKVRTYAAWVGEKSNPLKIEGVTLWFGKMARIYKNAKEEEINSEYIGKVKLGLGEIIMNVKEQLIEYIKEETIEEEYQKHN
jgi:hypothetical protein